MTLFEKCGAVLSAAIIVASGFMVAEASVVIPEDNSPKEQLNEHFVCLAKNIYFEARSESELAKRAVGWVTLNRVMSDRYPDSICEVVQQGIKNSDGSMRRHMCQFSWYCDGKSDIPQEEDEWREALRVAYMVQYNYSQFSDPVEGATMYHATYVSPRWTDSYERVTRIDSHIFYR